ncbi:bifunctional demethylmenaquinone methyltransferase/2-methoxy-6-polyprenyl-1,4-benzoquinol methylase UbiE [Candidatus Rariloculus sp.]|uniref:bifunctional demethylmenaquinone methyltransferase/2-methoxy-6-polyprenyl-1,4-benzoquinol methylase UbiE n=1 Tax=Candidatus Rariloculus sp. TaxID=3101265 RepID=UPI003D0B361D
MATEDKAESSERLTDFGFERLPWSEKKGRVKGVFDSVAPRYDLMNDAMSLGLHRLWKRFTIARSGLRQGQTALDVAAGSGDIALGLVRRVGPTGRVVVTDINEAMLNVGRDRLIDAGRVRNIDYVLADAEALPFRSAEFHCVTIGFGLRNVTDKEAALASMFRVLKPGGRLLVLEFSKPHLGPLDPAYDFYSFSVLPRLGNWLAGDSASYRYLAQSIRRHPDQRAMQGLLEAAGFERCVHYNLTAGIVALHVGYRL